MNKIRQFYDSHSFKYEEFEKEALTNSTKYPLLYEIRNKERSLEKNIDNKKVFYFATGSGADIVHLVKSGAKIVTLDFSTEMINRTTNRLKQEGILFELIKKEGNFSKEYLDLFFKSGKQVLIILGNIKKTVFPENYFDYTFCYCTLPLLQKKWKGALNKMLFTSINGAVSVYLNEKLKHLKDYYADFGFESEVKERTIYLKGGFAYYAIPPEDITKK